MSWTSELPRLSTPLRWGPPWQQDPAAPRNTHACCGTPVKELLGLTEHRFIQLCLNRVNLMKLGSLFPFSKFWLKYQLQK